MINNRLIGWNKPTEALGLTSSRNESNQEAINDWLIDDKQSIGRLKMPIELKWIESSRESFKQSINRLQYIWLEIKSSRILPLT